MKRTEIKDRWYDLRRGMCDRGWHWPIVWSDSAFSRRYDPPEPPAPGFMCDTCGKHRDPYRAWWWEVKWWWGVKERWLMARGKL